MHTCTRADDVAFEPLRFLSNEREQLEWKAEGLPGDSLSLENGQVLMRCAHTLLIDPTARAVDWLQRHLRAAGAERLELTEPHAHNFQTTLELALHFGKTLIVQEVAAIEPIIYPLLRGDLVAQGTLSSAFSLFFSYGT